MQITRRGYQKWENGESQIKPDKAQQLADFFSVSVGYLLGYEPSTKEWEELANRKLTANEKAEVEGIIAALNELMGVAKKNEEYYKALAPLYLMDEKIMLLKNLTDAFTSELIDMSFVSSYYSKGVSDESLKILKEEIIDVHKYNLGRLNKIADNLRDTHTNK